MPHGSSAAYAACAALTLFTACGDAGLTRSGEYPLTADVFMPNISTYSPFQTDIARTGTVRFNFAPEAHDVTFGTGAVGAPADIGDTTSVVIARQFNVAGTFNYLCRLHPEMLGRVVVH